VSGICDRLDEDVRRLYEELNGIATAAFICNTMNGDHQQYTTTTSRESMTDYLYLESPVTGNNIHHYDNNAAPMPYHPTMSSHHYQNHQPTAYFYHPPTDGNTMRNNPMIPLPSSSSSTTSAMPNTAVTYVPPIAVDHQLHIINQQLTSAQHKQRECIQHFDGHCYILIKYSYLLYCLCCICIMIMFIRIHLS